MNSSSDANQSGSPPFCLLGAAGYSRSLDTCVLEVVVILFLTVLIIAGNLVVISVFHCAPLLHHHTTGHFIQTMAYADLLVGVSCLVPSLSLLHFLRGLDEELTCKAFGYMVSVLKSVSMASLACISVDRYVAITRPLSYATLVTPCRLRACIVLIWVYSALVFLPSFFGWGKPGYHGDIFQWCAESWKTDPGFSTFIAALLYAPAALTVCFTYGSIFRICRQHTREITQRHARFSAQMEGGERGERCEGCPDKRYAMVLFRITSVFYVLWMPYILYFLLESAGLYHHQVASFLTTWLAISNSFCNCLIYSLSNSVFRKGLGSLFSPLFPSCLGCVDAKKAPRGSGAPPARVSPTATTAPDPFRPLFGGVAFSKDTALCLLGPQGDVLRPLPPAAEAPPPAAEAPPPAAEAPVQRFLSCCSFIDAKVREEPFFSVAERKRTAGIRPVSLQRI